MKIFDFLFGKKKAQDAYMSDARNSFISRWTRPPTMNTSEWLSMFSKSPRLAVVDRIASDLANIGGKLYQIQKDGSEVEVASHRFLDFMEQPNPLYEMTSSAMWRLHELYLMLVGESYFLIERDEGNAPVELWNVPPHWVKGTPYLGHPRYEIVSPGGLSMAVPVDDMFVMKQLNPLDPFMRGLGIAESIADEVEIDEYAAKFQKRFFYNDATPPVIFSMPNATPEQRDAFLARWNQKHKGVENSHKVAALSGEVGIHVLNNSTNIGFLESRIAMRDAVLEHFGVPREIMGITENSNRATADAAQYIYVKNVLTPKLKNREEAINRQLLPMFGENLVWRYNAVVPYDKDFDKSRAIDGYNAGLLTRNEARHLLDMDNTGGGDVFRIAVNDLFLNEGDNPTKVTQALMDDAIGVKGEKSRPFNIALMLRQEAAAVLENARLFEVAVTRHFVSQQSEVAKALGKTAKADLSDALAKLEQFLQPDGTFDAEMWNVLSAEEQQLLAEGVAAGLLNWKDEAKKLGELFLPLWKKAYGDGAKLNQDNYSLEAVERPEFVSAAKINGGKRIVGIEATTQGHIADIIAAGVANGSSQKELREEILAEMGTTKSRAKLIARQETMTALATGQFDMMKAAGAQTKTWHHRPQVDPRDGTHGKANHVKLEGETRPIDEKFSNGLLFPKDPNDGRPEELINCRCYLTYGGF